MDLFDDTIIEIKDWFEAQKKSGQSRSFFVSPLTGQTPSASDITAEGSSGRIVLKEDTQVELGHPSQGSCAATLATHRSDLVQDGCIHLVGPEITETRKTLLPFAQILIAALKKSNGFETSSQTTIEIENVASAMDRAAHRFAPSEGYMIRSVPNLIWARVSREACRSGFSLKQLGERLITAIKRQCPEVADCEVFFVTSSKGDVRHLDDLIEKARVKQRQLETYEVGPDGEYECSREVNCNTCSEQVVCDTIRDVIKIRKGDRVVTIRGEEETEGRPV